MPLQSHTDYFNQDVFDKDAVRSIKPFCIDMVSHVRVIRPILLDDQVFNNTSDFAFKLAVGV